jgi:hypothetical protein
VPSHIGCSSDGLYRDGKANEIMRKRKDAVFHKVGNRNKPKLYKQAVQEIKAEHKCKKFDMVVDFCAYDEDDIRVKLPIEIMTLI